MAISQAKLVHCLVLDSGPILKNEPPVSTLLRLSESLCTVPTVIEEILDAVARSRIETMLLPFLNLRTPTSASMKVVTDFARKTGDLEALSKPDIQVLALAYELECERNHGDWRLRSVPGQKRINGAPPADFTSSPLSPGPTAVPERLKSEEGLVPEIEYKSVLPPVEESVPPEVERDVVLNRDEAPDLNGAIRQIRPQLDYEADDEIICSGFEEFDNEGWITSSSVRKRKEKKMSESPKHREEHKPMQVATISTDFAIQNVLLRMNLNLLSPSLQRIRQLKTWVLRCHACFYITRDMSKHFCSRCGKPTLLRTSCSTGRDGNFKVHLKKNMQWNTRGNIYSIPKPVSGSASGKVFSGGGKGGWGQSLILAEDQKEYVQAMTSASRKKEKDLMDEDYLPNLLSGDRGTALGRLKVGAGKNVNSTKRNK